LSKLAFSIASFTIIAIFSALTVFVAADNANFIVQPEKEHVITLSLQETDGVSGSFSVVSDDDTGIDFYVVNALNDTVLRHSKVKHQSFSFTAEATGDYQLHFDNSASSGYEKIVALNYNVTHYIMGMPQEQFLFLIIAAVALIGIMLFAILMPR